MKKIMKKLILIRGPPAVGKSTIARTLRSRLQKAVAFDVDYFIHFFGGDPNKIEDRNLAYKIILEICKDFFVQEGYDIIIEEFTSLLISKFVNTSSFSFSIVIVSAFVNCLKFLIPLVFK